MNRNTEMHFTELPQISQNRSKFDMSHSVKTSFNVGDVIPLDVQEILPGDTEELDMASVIRMTTPIVPVMDNLIFDIYSFFVPNRLVWDHWEAFWGQNDDPWTQEIDYRVPKIESPDGGWEEGTIADYMGIPTKIELKGDHAINALPFRAYTKIINDFFRDENLQYACEISKDETTRTGVNTGLYVTDTQLGGKPFIAAKTHDYFTSCLPGPQKGPAVNLPLTGQLSVNTAPFDAQYPNINPTDWNKTKEPLQWRNTNGYTFTHGSSINIGGWAPVIGESEQRQNILYTTTTQGDTPKYNDALLYPSNLYADLGDATRITINQLRTAFAIQKYYEAAGRNGTRYIEYLKAVFGVESSDARLQRAEYLGGKRIPINMDQVLQTSATDATSPQGNTAAFSCTIDNDSYYTKSFEEHGFRIIVGVARVAQRTYQQGLNRMWSRDSWLSYYNPYFANLGEQAVLEKEIYCQGTDDDDTAFGYQEAWAEYRYRQNTVTGFMRSNASQGSMDFYHYADNFTEAPNLGETFIQEPKTNIDRTLAVTAELADQMFGDFYLKQQMIRCMPVYSIPGLIDHV